MEPTPERIALPTYPFARERYWIDGVSSGPASRQEPPQTRQLESIEEIIDQLDGGSIETDRAIAFLKKVV
jgi:acyl transferase domain-containing protein